MLSNGEHHGRSALVLFGSETGSAQDVAEEIGRIANRLRFSTRVAELDSISLNELLSYQVVLFSISTTGQGELPSNARVFWKKMRNARLEPGCLATLRFASFGLGDSSYPQFNWAHRKLYNRLKHLGASPICERGESDEQHPEGIEGCFMPWSIKVRKALISTFPLPIGLPPIPDDEYIIPKWAFVTAESIVPHEESTGSMKGTPKHQAIATASRAQLTASQSIKGRQTISAILEKNERLTSEDHWQDVRLFTFATPSVQYGPGDVLTIFPQNPAEDVQRLLDIMHWTTDADKPCLFRPTGASSTSTYYPPPPLDIRTTTLREILTNHLDINAIPRRSFFAQIAHFTSDDMQRDRLLEFTNPEYVDELYDYTTRPRRSIIEVLQEFDLVKIPQQWVASVFPIIRGRQFSIASGGDLKYRPHDGGRIELLVAIVKYRTVIKKLREGLCTKYLAGLEPGTTLEAVLCKGGMKYSPDRPAIMIGPGTGLAPLRSMAYERAVDNRACLRPELGSILFYGGRNRSADFFFEHEWPELTRRIGLEVITAFSRDQKSKVYVQDRLRENAKAVYSILRCGDVYVCGSSGKMPQAVREALIEIIQQESHGERAEAEAVLASMEKDGRYQQETW